MSSSSAADIPSAIRTSSEAWATLVANIAPLLVLVGEKHVKAYFKIMCRPSHRFLFAAGPIGLVTAVTTLIRLRGSRFMKRLIGRQFEARADVLVDVTSITGGDVSTELKNGVLEQTTSPDPSDRAFFFVQGRKVGSAAEIIDYTSIYTPELASIAYWRGAQTSSQQYTRSCEWTTTAVFRVAGPKAVETAREVAQAFPYGSPSGEALTRCEASAALHAAWTDVSLDLTASRALDSVKTDVARNSISILCCVIVILIIMMNWREQRDLQSVLLAAVGFTVSAAGSYVTATIVDGTSHQQIVNIQKMGATQAGFYSERIPEGRHMSFVPNEVVLSVWDTQPKPSKIAQLLVHLTVVAMALGYVALYLGLRSSQWWAALAILGNSALATLARVWLTPEGLELNESSGSSPNPFITEFNDITAGGDLLFGDEQALPQASVGTYESSPTALRADAPAMDGQTYEVITQIQNWSGDRRPGSSERNEGNRRFIYSSLSLLVLLRSRKPTMVPVELRAKPQAGLYSDLLGDTGVFRQPLEIMVRVEDSNPTNALAGFLMAYKAWHWRAKVLCAKGVGVRISTQDLKGIEESHHTLFSTSGQTINENDCLWMGLKIAYCVFENWRMSAIVNLMTTTLPDVQRSSLEPPEETKLLDLLEEAGLLID